jgi:hypothetical protein
MKISSMALVAGFCLAVGLPLAATAGPTPGGGNSDADTIENFFDNCQLDTNPNQKDFDHDGCGDLCDSDGNQDGNVNSSDFTAFKATYLKGEGQPGYNGNYDADCNGSVNSSDFTVFKGNYLQPTGPSGWPAAQRTLPACPGPNP